MARISNPASRKHLLSMAEPAQISINKGRCEVCSAIFAFCNSRGGGKVLGFLPGVGKVAGPSGRPAPSETASALCQEVAALRAGQSLYV